MKYAASEQKFGKNPVFLAARRHVLFNG